MKRFTAVIAGSALTAFAALSMAGPAQAVNETTTMDVKMPSTGGTLYKEAPRAVNWSVASKVNVLPGDATILPMKNANLTMPTELSFNPDPDMPVCPDDQIGEGAVSFDVPEALSRCGDSLIGNGLAEFALAQQTSLARDGVMLVFNGGMVKGLPRLKIYAYSYDTGVGLYTETLLQKNGDLFFPISQLTADSSVTSLNLAIPGVEEQLFVASKDITVSLPPGLTSDYAQATCKNNSWDWSGDFLFGQRDTLGEPTSPTTSSSNTGVTDCVGAAGKGKFGGVKVNGPNKVKKGKKGTFKVKVKNNGTATIKGSKVKASGKGASGKGSAGTLKPGQTKTVKVKVKFKKEGKVKTTFHTTGKGVSAKNGKITVKVK